MRKPTLIALLFFPLLASPMPPAISPPANEGELESLRNQLTQTKDRGEWETAAVSLLAALDRRGMGRGAEAQWLVNHMLVSSPDDPVLLWRRADFERAAGNTDAALEDLLHLIEVAPEHPLGIRARRSVPALYLQLGLVEQSARADEKLLDDGIADPVGILARLSRTYALLEETAKVRDALLRLERLAPERLAFDAEVFWLAADAATRVGTPREGLSMMMRFVNLFPDDIRRAEALLRAGEAYRELGNTGMALRLIEEAAKAALDPGTMVRARLVQGRIFEDSGRVDEARGQYQVVIAAALEPAPAAEALDRLLAIETDRNGDEGAAMMLVSVILRGDPFVREMARNHLDALMRRLDDEIRQDPRRAMFFYELVRDISQLRALSNETRLAVGLLYEELGDYETAAEVYAALTRVFGPPNQVARRRLARTRPEEPVPGVDPLDPGRIRGLERDERWGIILRILEDARFEGERGDDQRASAARAYCLEGRVSEARAVLEPVAEPNPELALLRGDARASGGDWSGACADYRRAQGGFDHGAELDWLEVRLAACEVREGHAERARARIDALLRRRPRMPAAFVVDDLLSRLPGARSRVDASGTPAS